MKDATIRRIKSTINALEHLLYTCPGATELLEEQITSLEQAVEDIGLWWEE